MSNEVNSEDWGWSLTLSFYSTLALISVAIQRLSYLYAVTTQRVIAYRGFIRRRASELRLDNLSHILFIHEGPDDLLRKGTLQMTSADPNAARLFFDSVARMDPHEWKVAGDPFVWVEFPGVSRPRRLVGLLRKCVPSVSLGERTRGGPPV